jgi:hypothetical protein
MIRTPFGPPVRRWPRNPVAPDPETVRQRVRSSGPAARPLL